MRTRKYFDLSSAYRMVLMNLRSDKTLGLVNQLEEMHLRRHAKFKNIKEHSNVNKVIVAFGADLGGSFDGIE